MACGHGFYNIFSQNYIHEYIEYFKDTFNIDLVFDNVVNNNQISGFIYYENKKIPVYIGLGDLQASINSFCFKKDFLLLNLATGSQFVSIFNECIIIFNLLYC